MPILFYFLNEIHFSFSTDTFFFPSALILISHFFSFSFWSGYFLEHLFSILIMYIKYPKKTHFWKD